MITVFVLADYDVLLRGGFLLDLDELSPAPLASTVSPSSLALRFLKLSPLAPGLEEDD